MLGEKKLGRVLVPDKWKDGARNTKVGKDRKLNPNMLLGKKKRAAKASPYGSKCRICRQPCHQRGAYCHSCAYKKGKQQPKYLNDLDEILRCVGKVETPAFDGLCFPLCVRYLFDVWQEDS